MPKPNRLPIAVDREALALANRVVEDFRTKTPFGFVTDECRFAQEIIRIDELVRTVGQIDLAIELQEGNAQVLFELAQQVEASDSILHSLAAEIIRIHKLVRAIGPRVRRF